MSMTLPIASFLLERARRFQSLGLDDRARSHWLDLTRLDELPAETACEAQERLAELCQDDDPVQERRHLMAALMHRPDDSAIELRIAQSHRQETDGDLDRAQARLLAALEREPDNAKVLCELGLVALDRGDFDKAVEHLERAHVLAPHDLDTLAHYADALLEADRIDEACDALKTAMFRNSGTPAFRDLYRDFQFRLLADEQRAADGTPMTLPFVLPQEAPKPRSFTVDGQIFRLDAPEATHGPSNRSASRKKHTK